MIRLLVPCWIEEFLANAGMPMVERSLMRALIETGRVRITLVASGTYVAHRRLAWFCRSLVRDGSLKIVPLEAALRRDVVPSADGLLLHGVLPPFSPWLARWHVVNRVPVMQHIHSLLLAGFEIAAWEEVWSTWKGWPPAQLVAPSQSTARRARTMRGLPPVDVVPHGVNIEQIAAGERRRGRRFLGVDPSSLLILSLNRISPDKCDYRQLLLAVHHLLEHRRAADHLQLALVGGGSSAHPHYIRSLEELAAQLHLRKRLIIVQNLDEVHKADVLAAADLFVSLASNPQESFGIALLEAMAASLPIVATDWDGYPEVLPKHYKNLLVPTIASHDAARTLDWGALSDACAPEFGALVERLDHLIGHEEARQQFGQLGRAWVAAFSWPTIAARLLALWEDLLERHRRGPRAAVRQSEPEAISKCAESPVDGLATRYLGANTLICIGLPARLPGDLPPPLLELCQRAGSRGFEVQQWRRVSRLGTAEGDRLLLKLLREGALVLPK